MVELKEQAVKEVPKEKQEVLGPVVPEPSEPEAAPEPVQAMEIKKEEVELVNAIKEEIPLVLKDYTYDLTNEHWAEKGDCKQRTMSIQSPGLRPQLIFDSPALAPRPPPTFPTQVDDIPSFFLKRKQSNAIEGADILSIRKNTEDSLEYPDYIRKGKSFRRERIMAIGESKEEREQAIKEESQEEDIDQDGFKRPRELRSQEKTKNDNSEIKKSASQPDPSGQNKEGKESKEGKTPSLNADTPTQEPISSSIKQEENNPPVSLSISGYSEIRTPLMTAVEGNIKKPEPDVASKSSPSFLASPGMQGSPEEQPAQNVDGNQYPPLDGQYEGEEFLLNGYDQNESWGEMGQPATAAEILEQRAKEREDEEGPDFKIGSLTIRERKEKILKYLEKRKRRIWKKKISYDCRKKVADKRLRIKGRFVTREQAYAILGTTAEDLSSNELLKKLINSNTNCSIVTSAQNMKIRNIQTLFAPPSDKHKQEPEVPKLVLANEEKGEKSDKGEKGEKGEKSKVKVEILKENEKDQIVEIKIETFSRKKGDLDSKKWATICDNNKGEKRAKKEEGNLKSKNCHKLPYISDPIFTFQKVKLEDLDSKHLQFHIEIGDLPQY